MPTFSDFSNDELTFRAFQTFRPSLPLTVPAAFRIFTEFSHPRFCPSADTGSLCVNIQFFFIIQDSRENFSPFALINTYNFSIVKMAERAVIH